MTSAVTELPDLQTRRKFVDAIDETEWNEPEVTESSEFMKFCMQELTEIMHRDVWEHCIEPADSRHTRTVGPRYVLRSYSGTSDYEISLLQYGEYPDTLIMVDFGEPTSEFPEEYQAHIDHLRTNGRRILADKLVTMLRNMRDDPDQGEVHIVSLQDMARLFSKRQEFADPFIGTDRRGIIHAQWRMVGNGVLVWGFLGYGDVLLVAQADETPDNEELDITTRGSEHAILEEFGHLVPRRN